MYKPKLTALSKQGKVTLQICLFRLKIEGRGRPSMMAFFLHFILCNHFQQMFGNFVNRHVLTKIKAVKILRQINPGKIFNLNPK